MTEIVIVGSGFAACTAVRRLASAGHDVRISVVAPRAELFFYPSLIWVPQGTRNEEDLRIDLTQFFRQHDVTHVPASAVGLDTAARTLITDQRDIPYDYLLIASGGRYLRGLPGIEHAHIACAGWAPTKAFSDALQSLRGGSIAFGFAGNPNEPSAMRGGPVFEFLFGTDTLLRQQGRRERFNLTFFSPAPKPGARMGEKAVGRLFAEMDRRGIARHFGHKLKRFERDRVITEGGEIPSDLTLFTPGMTGPAWAADSRLKLSDGGFFAADAQCRALDAERIYVAGDAGSFPGPDWKPKQAHMADLQAETAARNILADMKGQPQTHTFRTELICIVDALDTGTLVYRGANRSFQFKMPVMHWAKTWFESRYLKPYR